MSKKQIIPLSTLALLLASCAGAITPSPSSSASSSGEASSTSAGDSTSSTTPSSDSSSSSSEQIQEKTVVLDQKNGAMTVESYPKSWTTNNTGKDSSGEAFSITYKYGMVNKGYYGQFKKKEGVLRNTNALKGLKSIKVDYESTADATFCFSSSTDKTYYETLESGKTYYASSSDTYFFIAAGSYVLKIKSIEVTFGGEGGGSSSSSSSPSSSSSQSSGSSSSSSSIWDENYSAANATKDYTVNENFSLYDMSYNTPTSGTQNVLVLPIEFTDSTFTDAEIEDIKTLTSGSAEDTNYWESLGSYYNKSSYGKLDLQFTYADPTSMGMTAKQFYQEATSDQIRSQYTYGAAKAMRTAVEAYKKANGSDSTQKFDGDGDGFIDSVIMIYSCEYTPSYDSDGDVYWAYRYWDYWNDDMDDVDGSLSENTASPVGYSYFWSSLDFFYDGISKGQGIDSHTLIHEFGHMLGADDYYNTAQQSNSYEPSGATTMMAYNVLDHDAFNKLQYGWVTPYYVTGSTEITLNSFTETGDCILIADESGWNQTAFDEYILIEFYTPTGLNALDATTPYTGISSPAKPGVRIWHVDNRLYLYDENGYESSWATDSQIKSGNFGSYYPYFAISNSSSNYYSKASSKYQVLSLVSPKGHHYTRSSMATDNDLFHAGDVFTLEESSYLSTYSQYFAGSNKLDNGNSLPYKVEVSSLTDSNAAIRISKKA